MTRKIVKCNVIVLWALVLGCCLSQAYATLKTTYVEDLCYRKKSALMNLMFEDTGILMSLPNSVATDVDCTVTLFPGSSGSVVLSIFRYDLGPKDSLTIEDSDNHKIALLEFGNFKDERKSISSEGNMVIRYKRVNGTMYHRTAGFQFTFTRVTNSPCHNSKFQCGNGKCIRKEYLCDGHNHCGDNSDQTTCVPKGSLTHDYVSSSRSDNSSTIWIVSGLFGAFLLLVVILIAVLLRHRMLSKSIAANRTTDGSVPGGDVPMQQVSSSIPQQLPVDQSPSFALPPVQTGIAPRDSFYNRIRRSLRGRREPNVEVAAPHEATSESYQVPSMYPSLNHIATAPDMYGADNPEFKIEE